jgi:hypothetical protein
VTEALHIVRKDVKHLRWLLLVWVALLIGRVAFWSLGVSPISDQGYWVLLQRSTGTVESLLLLVLAFIAARLVHEEPLVGWNAFWYTRPYSRHSLMLAKLLLAAALFVALPLLTDVASMAMYHLGPRAQLEASASFISGYVTWMLLAIAMATLTPSLGTFVLATVASFTVLSLITMAIATVSVFVRDPDTVIAPVFESDPIPGIVATLLIDAAMLGVIVYQYRQRRWRPAAALAAAGIVASLAVPWVPRGTRPATDPGAWARNPSSSPAVIERRPVMRTAFLDGALKRLVYAPVRLTGVPRDYDFNNLTLVDSTLTLRDGTAVTSRPRYSILAPVSDPELPGTLTPRRAALGDVTLITGANEGNAQYWPAVIVLSARQYDRMRGTSGRLDATIQFHLNQTRWRAVVPLEAGAAHDDGLSRIEVIRTDRGPDGLTVTIRRWRAYSPLATRRYSGGFSFALYNRSRGEALTPGKRTQLPTLAGMRDLSRGLPVLSLMGAMSGGLRHDGLSMEAEQFLFPDRVEPPGGPRLFEPGWFDTASFAVLETSYAGTVTRSATIEDFPIPAE